MDSSKADESKTKLFTNLNLKLDNLKVPIMDENILSSKLNQLLKDEGCYSNLAHRTSGVYDCYIWNSNITENFEVELPEESVSVEVNFMSDFVIRGWSYYATFGNSSTGGWATAKALYCLEDSYDRDSEKFKSYLKHEGQHFADSNKYPNLIQIDKEYRAKLAELSYSNETTRELLSEFVSFSSESHKNKNAHAFANYCVISNLSKILFNQKFIVLAGI
jgi:hypothetical protein